MVLEASLDLRSLWPLVCVPGGICFAGGSITSRDHVSVSFLFLSEVTAVVTLWWRLIDMVIVFFIYFLLECCLWRGGVCFLFCLVPFGSCVLISSGRVT